MRKKTSDFNRQILPLETLFFASFILYFFAPVRGGDDTWFITTFLTSYQGNLAEFLYFRYMTWSTRLLLESYTLLLLYFPVLFRLFIPLWLTSIAAGFIRIFDIREDKFRWAICFSLLLIPVSFLGDVGFVCSSVNYIFTFACFLWGIMPLVDLHRGNQVPLWRYVLSVILMIFACNMEYYCPVIFIFSAYFLVCSVRRKNGTIFSVLLLIISTTGLIFAFNAPASTVSAYNETTNFFPGFESLTLSQKLTAGFVSTTGGLLSTTKHNNNFLIATLVFGILFLLYGLEQEKTNSSKLPYCFPLLLTLTTGIPARLLPDGHLLHTLFFHPEAGWKWDHIVPLILSFIFFGTILFGLFRLNKILGWSGFLSILLRTSMGISSSVFHSGLRTFYPLFLILCISCPLMLTKMTKRVKVGFLVFFAGIITTYFINLYFIIS